MVKKLRKILIAIFAVVFVTLMIARPMNLQIVSAGQGYVDHPAGNSYSYQTFVSNSSAYPYFMECVHTDLYDTDDMMVGLGLWTFYDPNTQYYYDYGSWWYCTQAGYNSATVYFMPPMVCYMDFDFHLSTATRYVYYDYNSGDWLDSYWYYYPYTGWYHNYPGYSFLYVGDTYNLNFDDRTSAAGMTQGAFYYDNDPYTVYYHYAQTQVPSGHSIPQGISPYAFLTAHSNSTGGDW